MYADDTNLSVTGESASDIEVRLNTELENVHEWLTANKLTLNTEKTEYMIIGSYKKISNIQKEGEMKTRKYMHAETPRLVDKTIVFSEHEVFKVVVMATW